VSGHVWLAKRVERIIYARKSRRKSVVITREIVTVIMKEERGGE
jgi:hypothetical protein